MNTMISAKVLVAVAVLILLLLMMRISVDFLLELLHGSVPRLEIRHLFYSRNGHYEVFIRQNASGVIA